MRQAGVEFQVSSQRLLRYRMIENHLKEPGKIYSQMLAASWVRQNIEDGAIDAPLGELALHAQRY